MKTKLSLLLFFLIAQVHAQTEVHKTYHDNGQLEEEGHYVNGKEEGLWKGYYENGQLEYIENYKNGVEHGESIEYYENGQIASKGQFKNGKEDGLWLSYFEDGSLRAKGTVIDGKPHGDFIMYEDVNKIKEKGTYEHGKKVGLWIENEYYSNGNIEEEVQTLDGQKHGVYKKFYEDGQLALMAEFKNGKANGPYKEYNKDGTLDESGEALMGERHGVRKEYYNGKLETLTTYNNGKKDGKYEDWNTFKNQIKEAGFYKNDEKSGYWKVYDDYGNVDEEGPYVSGKKHGDWKYYSTNYYSKKHKLLRKGSYQNGKKHGHWYYYNHDEDLYEYKIYDYGTMTKSVKDGIEYTYGDVSGSLYITGEKHYDNNTLVKTVKYVFEGNKIVDKETWKNGVLVSKLSDRNNVDYYKIYFNNKCRNKISVALRILNKDTNQWESRGWYNLAPYEEGYLIDTKNAIFYYYASHKDGEWSGKYKKTIKGKAFWFRKKDISGSSYGKKVINLTCNK